jgi:hypothetical protein
LALLIVYCLRNRRKDEFDGNFDFIHVEGVRRATLPKIDLGEESLTGNNGVLEVDEDDGMGGRLGAGPGCGGIITPYPFQLVPESDTAVGDQQNQNQPQMRHMSNIGVAPDGVGPALAAGYPNEKRSMMRRQQYVQHNHTIQPNSSGFFYPSSFYPILHLNSNSVSLESYSATSHGSSSLGGHGSGEIYYQSMGRGSSYGPSVPTPLGPSSGGRNSNEMEAMGRIISNPGNGRGQPPAFQHAYLQARSVPHQQQQCLSSLSPAAVPSQPPTIESRYSRRGT